MQAMARPPSEADLGTGVACCVDAAGVTPFEDPAAQAVARDHDEVLAIAAHELRTPVAAMAGLVQMLRRQVGHGLELSPDELDLRLGQIERQAYRVSELIGRLLEVASVDAHKLSICRETVDVRQVVLNVVDLVRVAVPSRQILIDAPIPIGAELDVVRIEQVLLNLLDNACKFSQAGCPIEICLRPGPGGVARLAVRDHGIGVPPEDRDHIFDRFFQARGERRSTGLGLGLYLGRRIAELHGGRLFAEFPPGGGTCFVLELAAARLTAATLTTDGLEAYH
jgi:signal transduction histidine kinase